MRIVCRFVALHLPIAQQSTQPQSRSRNRQRHPLPARCLSVDCDRAALRVYVLACMIDGSSTDRARESINACKLGYYGPNISHRMQIHIRTIQFGQHSMNVVSPDHSAVRFAYCAARVKFPQRTHRKFHIHKVSPTYSSLASSSTFHNMFMSCSAV